MSRGEIILIGKLAALAVASALKMAIVLSAGILIGWQSCKANIYGRMFDNMVTIAAERELPAGKKPFKHSGEK